MWNTDDVLVSKHSHIPLVFGATIDLKQSGGYQTRIVNKTTRCESRCLAYLIVYANNYLAKL